MSTKGNDKNRFKRMKGLIKPNAWPPWVSRVLAGAVGVILVTAAVLKATDMELFVGQLKDFGIISQHAVLVLGAWSLIGLEFGLGAALLVSYRPKLTLPFTGALFLVFLSATGWTWLSGSTEDCGCFGALVKHTPREAVIHDLIFLAATVLAWLGSPHEKTTRSRAKVLTVLVAGVIGLLLPFNFGFSVSKISQPPLKPIETALEELEIDVKDSIDLKKGEYIIVLIDTECLDCQEDIPEIDILASSKDLPSLIALCANEEQQRMTFLKEFQPTFRLEQISDDAFWRLLARGDVPRTILIRNGSVLQVWDQKLPNKNVIQAELAG